MRILGFSLEKKTNPNPARCQSVSPEKSIVLIQSIFRLAETIENHKQSKKQLIVDDNTSDLQSAYFSERWEKFCALVNKL